MGQWSAFDAELAGILEDAKDGRMGIFSKVYGLIGRQEKPGLALRRFLEMADSLPVLKEASEEEDDIAWEIMLFEHKCGTLVEGMLDNLMSDGMEEDDFYCALWNEIQESRYFKLEKEKIYAIYEIWTDGRIPYYKLPEGIQMDNEVFGAIIARNLDQIKKIVFILNAKYAQRTERSSLLIRILDSLETEEDKAVILAQILAVIDKRAFLRGARKAE